VTFVSFGLSLVYPQLAWEKGYVVVVAVVVVVVDYACLLNLNGDSVRVWYGSKLD